MPLDRRRLHRLVLFWVARLTGVLALGAVLYLMVRPPDRPVLPLLAVGVLAVGLLVVAHVLEPAAPPRDTRPDLARSDLSAD
ncbi:MAG: hypothetical protein HOQ22_04200 [Nocardioidaceae bacterium]|nr:hypothetical protein [Nocardioidaceae bacterium]NUS50228.1 hypothetical protein [Nocardioidaceae bacterium]